MRAIALVFALFALVMGAREAHAHGTRSVSVEVTEVAPGSAVVHVRPTSPGDVVQIGFAAPCVVSSPEDEGQLVETVTCPGSIAGATLSVDGLDPIVSEAIVVITLKGGQRISHVLTVTEPSFTLPAVQTGLALATSYVRLGINHILTGYDHLLFLLALVLLLRRPRAVLAAETAFTVSHSLTFSATALGLVHVSASAAEAAIALSLVLLALDIGRPGVDTSTRKGALLAFVFGLVHGLGFASGLSEIGLPDHDVSLALLGFAGGIEVGQVAFLAVFLLFLHVSARLLTEARLRRTIEPALVTAIGGVSSYWLIARTLAIFAGT